MDFEAIVAAEASMGSVVATAAVATDMDFMAVTIAMAFVLEFQHISVWQPFQFFSSFLSRSWG